MAVPFFDHRLVVVSGKGGVGRSTVCAALALEAARRDRRVLVCELNTRERIPSLFGAEPGGHEIRSVADGIWSVNIRPEDAMREYGLMKLRLRALYRAAFENRVVRSFLRIIPGLPELLMLGKIYFHTSERLPRSDRPRWDTVVVDAPATGHGIPFLRIPQVVLSVTSSGPMADDARRIRDLLTDPERTSLNIVTLPEAMPVQEAIELKRSVDDLLGIPMGYLFVNRVHPRLFLTPASQAFATLRTGYRGADPLVRGLIEAGRTRILRRRLEAHHLDRLRATIDMPRIRLPYLYVDRWGDRALATLAHAIDQGVEHHERRY